MPDQPAHASHSPRFVWCREPLRFVAGQGYAHKDWTLYRTRIDPDGVERDDHRALPDRSKETSP